MFKKLLFTFVFILAGFVGLNAQMFPCGVQNLTSCNCPGQGLLVADSTPCGANSGEAQLFLLVDAVDATVTSDPDTNGIVATSLTGNFTVGTGDYVLYSLIYSTANAAQIFPSIGLGTNIGVLQSLGTMTAPGVWTGTNPSFLLESSGLAVVNGPTCNCDGTGTTGTATTTGTTGATGGGSGTGSIGDLVFYSGGPTAGSPIGGVTVALFGDMQNLLGTQVTDANGGYDFTGLPAGFYQVVVGQDPNGGMLSGSTPAFYNVTIADGEDFNGADFSFALSGTGTTGTATGTGTTGTMTTGTTGATGGTGGAGGCVDIDATHAIDCLSDVPGQETYTVILTLGGPLAAGGFEITRPDGSSVLTGAQNGYTDTNTYSVASFPTYTYTITSLTDPSCSVVIGPILAICSGPTPIELVDFEGTEAGKANYLHWETGSEFNNDYFTLLRSEDGANFEMVSQIPSQGNSTSAQNYEFYDYDFRSNVTYYRLLQTDNNGQASTAGGIIVVERKDFSFDISNVYPVPSSDLVNIDFLNDKEGSLNVNVYDVTGRIIERFDLDANSGFNTLELNIGHYAIGTYFVTLSTDNETVTAKFIKD